MKRQTLFPTALVFCCLFAALCVTQAKSSGGTESSNSDLGGQGTSNAPADLTERIRALSSANPIERASAACQIGEMGKRAAQAIPNLIQMLGDDTQINATIYCGERSTWRGKHSIDEPTTPGRVAAQSLAAIGEQSVEPLISVVRNANPIVRMNAVWSLGIINDPRTVEPVIAASRDGDARVRENASWGMGLKHDRSVVEPLIAALGDGEWRVREKAGWSLGLQGDARAVEPLANALKDENASSSDSSKVRKDPPVFVVIMRCIGSPRARRALEPRGGNIRASNSSLRRSWKSFLASSPGSAVNPAPSSRKDQRIRATATALSRGTQSSPSSC